MTTTSKFATVTVSHGNDKIAIQSRTRLEIDFTVMGVSYSPLENNLFSRIERGPSPRPMELSYAELGIFKGAHERYLEATRTDKPTVLVDRADVCKPSNVETVTPNLPPIVRPETTVNVAPIAGAAPIHHSAPVPAPEVKASVDTLASRFVHQIGSNAVPEVYQSGTEVQHAERSIRMLEEAVRILSENGIVSISYDVPDRVKQKVGNLRRKFMKLGFLPKQKSVLIGIDKVTKTPEFRAIVEMLARNHVRFDSYPLHDTIAAMVREEAKEMLRSQIVQWHRSLILNIASAADRISEAKAAVLADESKGTADLETAENKEHNSMRATIREACESLEIAIQLAELYDDSQDTKALIEGLRAAIQSQAQTFNAMARMKRIKPAPMPS